MKITNTENGSFDVKLSPGEAKGLLSLFVHGLIGAGELKFNPETKEYEPTEDFKKILGSVVNE